MAGGRESVYGVCGCVCMHVHARIFLKPWRGLCYEFVLCLVGDH